MPTSFDYFDYNRTVIGFHGTSIDSANRLVNGESFDDSDKDDEWFGKGVYFWEYAPKQAWWWARSYKGEDQPAVVGAIIRLGNCLDLLDPMNIKAVQDVRETMLEMMQQSGLVIPVNVRSKRRQDCAVFNYFFHEAAEAKKPIDSARAVYVPTGKLKRAWEGSWINEESHIQISVRNQKNILAVWHVREDGRYGKDG